MNKQALECQIPQYQVVSLAPHIFRAINYRAANNYSGPVYKSRWEAERVAWALECESRGVPVSTPYNGDLDPWDIDKFYRPDCQYCPRCDTLVSEGGAYQGTYVSCPGCFDGPDDDDESSSPTETGWGNTVEEAIYEWLDRVLSNMQRNGTLPI